jgi:LPXTG-motif cell wall-anchored protein
LTGGEATSEYDYEDLHDSYLAWAIELSVPPGYLGTDDMVIHEDLPEGVSVKGLDLSFLSEVPTSRLKMRDMAPGNTYTWDFKVYPLDQYDIYYEPHRTGAEDISITVKVTDSGDLEITVPGVVFELMGGYAAKSNLTQAQTYLYIYTQINDDFAWTPKSEGSFKYVNIFENRFTLKNESGRVLDIGSQSQEVTMDESKEIIRKDATIDDNNIITYAVLLNTKQKDLIKNAATLKVHDELTYTETADQPLRLRLVPGSVKLYEITMNADGTYTKGNEVKTNYNYEETSTVQYGRTAWTHTIDLTIPDNKALVLEYKYRAAGVKTVMHNISNTCTIQGIGEGGLDENHKIEILVKETMAQADTSGVMLYKVDANSDGVFLEKAKFNIYIWNEDAGPNGEGAYIIVNHPDSFELDEDMGVTDFVTSKSGMIVIDGSTIAEGQFAYNTAYYIVEKESPEGYYLSPEPYYFQIVHPELDKYPRCQPDDFAGALLTRGDIIYRENVSATTEISVEKYWKSYNGANMTVTGKQVSEVNLELWQELEGDPNSAKIYGTYKMTPDEKGNWSLTITGLPKATKKADGTKDKDYLYYIKEVSVSGFTLESSENNGGINSGIIKLVNRELEGYELPETGGAGTQLYTTAGLLLMLSSAAYLLYIHRKRRREASS